MNPDNLVTVLLVEDSPDDERLSLRALRGLLPFSGIAVAHDGQEALDALGLGNGTEEGLQPALVLCDMKMPRLNGDEVLRRVRSEASLRGLPFVVFSSSDEPDDVSRCEALGATEYVVKPIEVEAYGTCVAGIVGRHLQAYVS
jgi:CheY-like chemotaxis protein